MHNHGDKHVDFGSSKGKLSKNFKSNANKLQTCALATPKWQSRYEFMKLFKGIQKNIGRSCCKEASIKTWTMGANMQRQPTFAYFVMCLKIEYFSDF